MADVRKTWRIIFSVVVGYLVNAVLVAITEQLLFSVSGGSATPPRYYFAIDLPTQCLYTVIGGFVCGAIARPVNRVALYSLIGLGLIVGTSFLLARLDNGPLWYDIVLLAVYAPCAWVGWKIRSRTSNRVRIT